MAIAVTIALLIGAGVMYIYMSKQLEEFKGRFNNALEQALISERAAQLRMAAESRSGTHKHICGMIKGWNQHKGYQMWKVTLAPAGGKGKLLHMIVPFGTEALTSPEQILNAYPQKDIPRGDTVVLRAATPAKNDVDDWDIGLRQVDVGVNFVPTHILFGWIPAEHRELRKKSKITRYATMARQPGISLETAFENEFGVIDLDET
jgi:hypothetical protein